MSDDKQGLLPINNKLPITHKLFIPSLFDLIVITTFITIIAASSLIKSYDIWWHLRTGDLILQGVFPFQDLFSYTAFNKTWILHEWGSEVIFSFVYKTLGISGLIVLKAFLCAILVGLVFKIMVKKGVNILISFAFIPVIILGTTSSWSVRPHIFTNIFLIILFSAYIDFKHYKSQKSLMFLPVLFLLWINMHGGFIIGFVFLGTCIVAESLELFLKPESNQNLSSSNLKKLIAYTIISFAVCFINPNTYKGVLYPFLYIQDQIPSHLITEWAPSSLKNHFEFVTIVFLIVLGFAFSKKKLFLYEIFLIVLFTYFAFSAIRHIAIFTIIVIPIISVLWQDIIILWFARIVGISKGKINLGLLSISEYFSNRSSWFLKMEKCLDWHFFLVLTITIVIITISFLGDKLHFGVEKDKYPLAITNYIKSINLEGNLFNQYSWGGFLIWSFPDKKIFIDGRMDVYKKKISSEYTTIMSLNDGWEDILKKYSINYLLVKRNEIISKYLTKVSDEWVLVKKSENACFFKKRAKL